MHWCHWHFGKLPFLELQRLPLCRRGEDNHIRDGDIVSVALPSCLRTNRVAWSQLGRSRVTRRYAGEYNQGPCRRVWRRSVSMVTSSKHWKEICSYTILKICLAAHWNCLGWSASGSRRTRVSPCILPAVEEQQQRFAMRHPLNLDLNRSHWYCKILSLSRDIRIWYFQKTIWWPLMQNGSQYLMLLKM